MKSGLGSVDSDKKRFVFCIVTYNSKKRIEPTVRAAQSAMGPRDALVVVDNGSVDGTADFIEEIAPEATVIRQGNVGFGKGNNAGFNAVESKYFVILNPDITFNAVDLDRVDRYFEDNPHVVSVVGDVRHDNPENSRQYINRDFPTFSTLLRRRFNINLLPDSVEMEKRLARYELRNYDFNRVFKVPCGTGSFQIVRRSSINGESLFDPRFFMYMEDIDLARRLWNLGEVHYVPWMVVTHEWGRESYRSWRQTFRHIVSFFRYWFKWGSFEPRTKFPVYEDIYPETHMKDSSGESKSPVN